MKIGAPFTEQQTRRQGSLQSAVMLPLTALQTTASTLLTVRDGVDLWLNHLWVANTTGGAVTYTLYFVPPSGSPATANAAVFARSLPANTPELVEVAINHRLGPGSTIQALCSSNNAINMGGWGYFIQGEA